MRQIKKLPSLVLLISSALLLSASTSYGDPVAVTFTPSANDALTSNTPNTAIGTSPTSHIDHSLLSTDGNWRLTVQGGASYSLPYTSAAVREAINSPGTTYDLSSDQAAFGGVSLGRAFKHRFSLEVGGVLLAPRHYHVIGATSDIQRDLQTGFLFGQINHHWFVGWDNTLSLGTQAGLGLLFENNQSLNLGQTGTTLSSDIGLELSPSLRLDHFYDDWQSFGLEIGYRFLRFAKSSGQASDPLNFSGLTLALRWTTQLGLGPLAKAAP